MASSYLLYIPSITLLGQFCFACILFLLCIRRFPFHDSTGLYPSGFAHSAAADGEQRMTEDRRQPWQAMQAIQERSCGSGFVHVGVREVPQTRATAAF